MQSLSYVFRQENNAYNGQDNSEGAVLYCNVNVSCKEVKLQSHIATRYKQSMNTNIASKNRTKYKLSKQFNLICPIFWHDAGELQNLCKQILITMIRCFLN